MYHQCVYSVLKGSISSVSAGRDFVLLYIKRAVFFDFERGNTINTIDSHVLGLRPIATHAFNSMIHNKMFRLIGTFFSEIISCLHCIFLSQNIEYIIAFIDRIKCAMSAPVNILCTFQAERRTKNIQVAFSSRIHRDTEHMLR